MLTVESGYQRRGTEVLCGVGTAPLRSFYNLHIFTLSFKPLLKVQNFSNPFVIGHFLVFYNMNMIVLALKHAGRRKISGIV